MSGIVFSKLDEIVPLYQFEAKPFGLNIDPHTIELKKDVLVGSYAIVSSWLYTVVRSWSTEPGGDYLVLVVEWIQRPDQFR